jgi:hypothetical protein
MSKYEDPWNIWKDTLKQEEEISEHFKMQRYGFDQELVKLLRKRADEYEKAGRKLDAFYHRILGQFAQSRIWDLDDREILTKKCINMQGLLLVLSEGSKALIQLTVNLAKRLPQESERVEEVMEKLTEYQPILDAVYAEIAAERKKMIENKKRMKHLGGKVYT